MWPAAGRHRFRLHRLVIYRGRDESNPPPWPAWHACAATHVLRNLGFALGPRWLPRRRKPPRRRAIFRPAERPMLPQLRLGSSPRCAESAIEPSAATATALCEAAQILVKSIRREPADHVGTSFRGPRDHVASSSRRPPASHLDQFVRGPFEGLWPADWICRWGVTMLVAETGCDWSAPDPGTGPDVRCLRENGKPDVSRGRKATGPLRVSRATEQAPRPSVRGR
jgi:hypothetical protein